MAILKEQLEGFVPSIQAAEIIKQVARGSSIIRLSKAIPMESDNKKFPVLADGPGAYWVGEGERISTSEATWIYPEMKAKKIAVIIPVTKEKLKDTVIDVFNELTPLIAEAFYKTIDSACLFGTNSPFAHNIYQCAIDNSNYLLRSAGEALDISVSNVMALVEEDGYDVNGFIARHGMKNTLRKLRDANGNQLFVSGVDTTELYNQPIEFNRNGAWNKEKADLIGGDFSYSYVGFRDNIEFEVLKEATLIGTNAADGKPISLAEQDMIAIKATMRLGYLPVKQDAFAVLAPQGSNHTNSDGQPGTPGSIDS